MNDNNNYISEPILINLPSQNIDGTYEYSTNIYPKYIKLNNIDTFYDKEIEINWLDKGYGNYRPKQVTIELLENNILKEELVVSRLDNWHKTIKSLNSNKTYNIVIKDLNNYDISICNDYDKFIIYNTFNNKNIVKENILNTKILNNNLINYRLIKGNFVTPIDLRLEAI